ncbi:sensor histidine kinase [Isoptericola dokdonensis]|uniref:histidine kinase n=1 Tax=Isoptericola dokdonensis DS-3 TaxID=1300344 RepID=A0A168FHG1_9MICO|nr:histidine kinase [Isoptericola dokdonensis]ANC31776.1 Sensor histidine kinase LiaS [Isoptericola dokdonensis DS-3]
MPAQAPSDDPDPRGPAAASRTSRRRSDVVLAVATTAGVTVAGVLVPGGTADGGDPARAAASALVAVVVGALVLLRRRAPSTMLALTAVVTVAAAVADVPAAASALPTVTALAAAAAGGRARAAAGTGTLVVLALTVDRAVLDAEGAAMALPVPAAAVLDTALVVAAVAVGVATHLRGRLRALATEAAEPGPAVPQEGGSRHREHLRIAHDLHDVVAHHLSMVALHSGVASAAVGRDDDAARTALRHVTEATSVTLHELRATTLVLRAGTDPGTGPTAGSRGVLPAATGPAGLSSLVEPVRAAGVDVVTRVEVPAASIDASVDAAAYRIVQEALATVVRHGAARRAVVRLTTSDGRLRITVSDDGRGAAADRAGADPGMVAVRERALALGGSLTVRDVPAGGLTVVADLPARLREAPRPTSVAATP